MRQLYIMEKFCRKKRTFGKSMCWKGGQLATQRDFLYYQCPKKPEKTNTVGYLDYFAESRAYVFV